MKKCKLCGDSFQTSNTLAVVCSVSCAISFAKNQRIKQKTIKAKAERKEIRAKRESIKTRSQWIKEAQVAFNAYIRERDRGLPCICCQKAIEKGSGVGGTFDAGHYRSVGSAPHLRFDEDNCHGQKKQCNRYGSGRAVDYRIGLIKRIGLEKVEKLESDNEPRKYSIDELKEIISTYRAKTKELRNGD